MRNARLIATLVGLAALSASVGTADAQGRRVATYRQAVNEAPPLTVNRRSFLDPGPVVPVGSLNNYVVANTTLNTPIYATFNRRFGEDALPQPLEVPGRRQPVFEFETPGY